MKRAIVIDERDNVANLIGAGRRGETVRVEGPGIETEIVLADDIPANHKFACRPIESGQDVVKYGARIGRATCAIAVGAHVHVHNVESLRGRGDRVTATDRR